MTSNAPSLSSTNPRNRPSPAATRASHTRHEPGATGSSSRASSSWIRRWSSRRPDQAVSGEKRTGTLVIRCLGPSKEVEDTKGWSVFTASASRALKSTSNTEGSSDRLIERWHPGRPNRLVVRCARSHSPGHVAPLSLNRDLCRCPLRASKSGADSPWRLSDGRRLLQEPPHSTVSAVRGCRHEGPDGSREIFTHAHTPTGSVRIDDPRETRARTCQWEALRSDEVLWGARSRVGDRRGR